VITKVLDIRGSAAANGQHDCCHSTSLEIATLDSVHDFLFVINRNCAKIVAQFYVMNLCLVGTSIGDDLSEILQKPLASKTKILGPLCFTACKILILAV